MVKVKVCGITNFDDALKAIEYGADALGFNFYPPSARCVSPGQARAILAHVTEAICKVAVFVNEPRKRVEEILRSCVLEDGRQAFQGLQFHGDESPEYCRGWGLKVIKAFRVKDQASLAGVEDFPADFCLLDTWVPGYGGSGAAFPWRWLSGFRMDRAIIAGGLDAGNVEEAVRLLRPYGVDVCTGVEAKPGLKDHGKLKEFIRAAKSAG
jgi:phosphoribosylanthranilate isomerase